MLWYKILSPTAVLYISKWKHSIYHYSLLQPREGDISKICELYQILSTSSENETFDVVFLINTCFMYM